ncbi:hypothetical protein BHAP_0676 [Bifidobacterium hapali]|uniref:Acyltransferase n=1 Tax=Bifidobacterium hapali TaxID=1630172 RepID=A0A261G1Z1_9BIFI|nr:hypothetical protein [Bifidobacterium hapali]OZG65398.1 hypothetical protein BHAP_0676 [Bifidobacterium hapali]
MIGIWGGQCSRSNRIPRLWKITIAVTLIALGIAGFSLGLLPLDIKSADFGTPILSILCAGMLCVGATMLGQQLLNGKRISFATWLSTRGLPVIFIHPLILMLTKQMGNATVVGFLFATVVSFIIAILIHISPKLARLLG